MFSVVIPLYNKENLVKRTVASALSQAYSDFELIVVDDGSTDDSASIVAAIDDPRLRFISQPNCGPGPARNRGVEASRSEWIAFLDADDIWLADHLEELDSIRRAHPEAGLIGTAFARASANSVPENLPVRSGAIGLVPYFDAVGRGEDVLLTSTAAVRKQAWRSVCGFPDHPSGEDSELWVRLASRWPVAASTKITAIYLSGTGGISDRQKTRWLGKPLREIADLSPAAAFLVREGAGIRLNGSPEKYIERCLYWCLHGSARVGDLETLRALRPLYRNPPSLAEKAILASSTLPARLAKAAHRVVFLLQAIRRRVLG
jgi:glycosyltransferase involved in cell wall biosynthesis